MEFVKMEGLGNDFVVLTGPVDPSPTEIAKWCDRRRGIGADGVLVATATDDQGVAMKYWNADGSAAEMCGNGLRCVARYAVDCGFVESGEFVIATSQGPRRAEVGRSTVRVELGRVEAGGNLVHLEGYDLAEVSVGNLHAVAFVRDCYSVPLEAVGPVVEGDPHFPERTNVEFASVITRDRLALRVWERGVGETLSCGTGAAAAVAEAFRNGYTGPSVTVLLPGGELWVEIIDSTAWIEGPATTVYSGRLRS